jgi:hypothetical protein
MQPTIVLFNTTANVTWPKLVALLGDVTVPKTVRANVALFDHRPADWNGGLLPLFALKGLVAF